MTDWDLTTTGYLNGARVRIYRIVDAQGQPLPQDASANYINLTNAASYALVGTATVPEAGEPGLPLGGWLNTVYTIPGPVWGTRANLDFTDARWVENGHTYYYIVTAVGNNTSDTSGVNESDPALAPEVTATPQVGIPGTPHIFVSSSGDGFNEIGSVTAGGRPSFIPGVAGATGALTWQLLNENNNPLAPPAGLMFNSATGELGGSATNTPPATRLRFRVTAANGVATRDVILNNPAWTPTGGATRSEPPSKVTATDDDGCVYHALNGGVPCYFTVEALNSFGFGTASAEKPVTPLTSFDAWRNSLFTLAQIADGQADDLADPDGDGLNNLIEYAFGSNPMQPFVTRPVAFRLEGLPKRLSVTFPQWADRDDITITVEASTDLVTWTPLASSSLGSPITALIAGVTVSSAGSVPATVTVFDTPAKAAAPCRFLWVRITRP